MGRWTKNNSLRDVSTMAIVNELQRRSVETKAVTCVKKEDVYIITVEKGEVDIYE
jgi:hypothetical protein